MESNIIELDLKNINVGQIIKNYKVMCSLLGQEVKDGSKGKGLQLKDWKRYFNWENEGHKFIITEIFDEPKLKMDGRVNNGGHIANTKYEELMDQILINLLIDYDGYIEESFSQIMDMIDFFSGKYSDLGKAGYKTFAEINDLGLGVTKTYQQKLFNVVRDCLETSLNRLNRRGIITYEKRILVRGHGLKDELADVKMEQAIKDIEQKVYKEMKISYYNRINMEINRQFKSKVGRYLDFMTYWNVYCFELLDKNMEYVEEDKDELIRRLTKSVVEQVKKQKSKKDGEVFYPYSYSKYQLQIDRLTRLIWKLPENFITETEFEKLLIGKDEGVKNRFREYEDIIISGVETLEEYNDLEWGIPF